MSKGYLVLSDGTVFEGKRFGADRDALESPALRLAAAGATLIVQMASFPETLSSRGDAELQADFSSTLRIGAA